MITLQVNDMTCGHCVGIVTQAIKQQDDQARIEIDLESKSVKIDSSKPAQQFIAAIADAGYTPE